MKSEIMTIKENAKYLKITQKTACHPIDEGRIPSFKIGDAQRFRQREVLAWTDRQ